VAAFYSAHYDAAIYGPGQNTGCFAGRASGDPSGHLADRFIELWSATYPLATGIPLRPERLNPNVTDYYAFRDTPATVPGVLIEHGCGAPVGTGGFPPGQDAALLHGQIERVADADTAAILGYLIERGLLPADGDDVATIAELQAQIAELNGQNTTRQQQIDDLRAEVDGLNGQNTERQRQIDALREEVGARNADVAQLQAEHGRLLGGIDTLTKEVAALTEALANAPTSSGRPIHVTVMTEDSTEHDFVPVA
jgi:uncharacterized coiled-coil protein SlyX